MQAFLNLADHGSRKILRNLHSSDTLRELLLQNLVASLDWVGCCKHKLSCEHRPPYKIQSTRPDVFGGVKMHIQTHFGIKKHFVKPSSSLVFAGKHQNQELANAQVEHTLKTFAASRRDMVARLAEKPSCLGSDPRVFSFSDLVVHCRDEKLPLCEQPLRRRLQQLVEEGQVTFVRSGVYCLPFGDDTLACLLKHVMMTKHSITVGFLPPR